MSSKSPTKQVVAEICQLQSEIESAGKVMIDKAIRIGELLVKQKADVLHGEWIPWVEDNLPFDRRQASSYMRAFIHRKTLKGQSTAHLTDAITALATPQSRKFTSVTKINLSDIEANPYFDIGWLPPDSISNRVCNIREMGVYWVKLVVRQVGDKFQLVADHAKWAAMKLSNIEDTEIGIVDLSDKQMQRIAEGERYQWRQEDENYDWRMDVDTMLGTDWHGWVSGQRLQLKEELDALTKIPDGQARLDACKTITDKLLVLTQDSAEALLTVESRLEQLTSGGR